METIFTKLLYLNSRATGPKILVPTGSLLLFIKTAELSSKRMAVHPAGEFDEPSARSQHELYPLFHFGVRHGILHRNHYYISYTGGPPASSAKDFNTLNQLGPRVIRHFQFALHLDHNFSPGVELV